MSVCESGTRVPPLLSFTVTLLVSNDISEFTYQIALTHKYAPPLSQKMKQKQNTSSALSNEDRYSSCNQGTKVRHQLCDQSVVPVVEL